MQNIKLLIIDPQIDFCDGPANGKLAIPGAWNDMERLSHFVNRYEMIDDIFVTLDTHHICDIAHSVWWTNKNDESPPPFTTITVSDIENGLWFPRNPLFVERSFDYIRKLDKTGKNPLIIWPEHCLIGSQGHAVHPVLFDSLKQWEHKNNKNVHYILKGTNPFTEHYSAVKAEIPDILDSSTLLNTKLIDKLQNSDVVFVAGEALSHCVKATLSDIFNNIGDNIEKYVFLEDCSSSVPFLSGGLNYPEISKLFLNEMQKKGMKLKQSTQIII